MPLIFKIRLDQMEEFKKENIKIIDDICVSEFKIRGICVSSDDESVYSYAITEKISNDDVAKEIVDDILDSIDHSVTKTKRKTFTCKDIISVHRGMFIPTANGTIDKILLSENNEFNNIDFECAMFENGKFIVAKMIMWTQELFGRDFFVVQDGDKQKLVVLCCFVDKELVLTQFKEQFNVLRPIAFENVNVTFV